MTRKLPPFHEWIQLEQPRLGTRVTFASDEFFGAKERLIEPDEPVFIAGRYDDHGKWMDGWESRRRRVPGHDFCIIRLGIPGIVRGVNIDTSHFSGNHPPQASIDACISDSDVPDAGWFELLPTVDLAADTAHFHPIGVDHVVSHLRLNIYPDGGIARLRVFGEVRADFTNMNGVVDLVAIENGGRALLCSNEHFGSMHKLNLPGRGVNMGDGWETARRRRPGNDWVILALGHPGTIERVEIDTAHFKGNYPDCVSLEAALYSDPADARPDSEAWQTLLPRCKLEMDSRHEFAEQLVAIGDVSHVRMSIYPDGGISRLRLFGRLQRS